MLKTLVKKHRQNDSRIRTHCRRGQLARSAAPFGAPDPEFLRRLAEFDKEVELYWHPLAERWVLYRVRRKGCASDDVMIHEATIKTPGGNFKPPSFWLIDQLKEWDKTKQGKYDIRQANRQYNIGLHRQAVELSESKDKEVDKMCDSAARDMWKVARNPHSMLKNGDL